MGSPKTSPRACGTFASTGEDALANEAGHPRAHRITADRLPFRRIEGCVLSNEFLDALPVHQVVVEEGRLREVFVALDDGGLVAVTGNPSTLSSGRAVGRR